MDKIEYAGWLMEVAEFNPTDNLYRVWISTPDRIPVGYGRAAYQSDAVRAAFADASHHYRADPDSLYGLQREYWGPEGAPLCGVE